MKAHLASVHILVNADSTAEAADIISALLTEAGIYEPHSEIIDWSYHFSRGRYLHPVPVTVPDDYDRDDFSLHSLIHRNTKEQRMTKSQSFTDKTLKLFEVTYCVEQGYAIQVEAHTAEEAERIVEQRLNNDSAVLRGSRQVHHAHFVNTVEELAIARSDNAPPQETELIDTLKLALLALNTARRFKVYETDSYAIAARIDDVRSGLGFLNRTISGVSA